jgi:hypothetical protein
VRRALTAAALAASLLGLAPTATAAPTAACDTCLRAGAARVAFAVPPGTPLAGYGDRVRRLLVPDLLGRYRHAFWFRPHAGSLDPIGARALVLESEGHRLTWLAVDLVAVDRAFTARVSQALQAAGLSPGTLMVSASHTHSGPGAFMQSGVLGIVAVDRQDRDVTDALVGSLVEATRRAEAAKVPARMASASVTAPELTTGRLGQPVDPEIVVLKIVSDSGTPIASVWNYAIHGTMLPAVNLRLSGDVMGVASRELERITGVPALFVNGAVGDVSPARHGEVETASAGRELAAAVRSGWDAATHPKPAALSVARARVVLPPPVLSVRNCVGRWVPRRLTVPLGGVIPREAELVAVRLGRVAWVAVPGELQSRLGETIKRAGRPALDRVLVAGLSNDYLGYFVTAADYQRVTYVACASLYGPEAGARLTEAAADLIHRLAAPAPAR